MAFVSGRYKGWTWPPGGAAPAKRPMAQSHGQCGGSLDAHALLKASAMSL